MAVGLFPASLCLQELSSSWVCCCCCCCCTGLTSVPRTLLEFSPCVSRPCQAHIVSSGLKHNNISAWYCMQMFACGAHACVYLLVFRQLDQTVSYKVCMSACQASENSRPVPLGGFNTIPPEVSNYYILGFRILPHYMLDGHICEQLPTIHIHRHGE